MKILLLSAYDAQSHQYWRRNLVAQLPQYDWTVLCLPARYFSWRVRGNSLSWAFSQRQVLDQNYDLVIATSMTDLSALRGFVPRLASTPCLVYFHENQFAYPQTSNARSQVEPALLNIYTALAADLAIFNSAYNHSSFLDGAEKLLKKLPDQIPNGLSERLQETSMVLPVPLVDSHYVAHQTQAGALNILWNHRWEHDKGPELLLEALRQLSSLHTEFKLHIVGQQFRDSPAAFETIRSEFATHLESWGYVESEASYRQLLQHSDVVVSTAHHDFQGLAILEAVAAGCLPMTPKRLAYPEMLGNQHCYQDGPDQHIALAQQLDRLATAKRHSQLPSAPDISHLSWQSLKGAYQQVIEQTATKGRI